jgi:hypothetical protein
MEQSMGIFEQESLYDAMGFFVAYYRIERTHPVANLVDEGHVSVQGAAVGE